MLQRQSSMMTDLDSSMTKLKRSRSISIKKKKSVIYDEPETTTAVKVELVHVQKDEVNEQDSHKLATVLETENKGNFEGRYLLVFLKKNIFYKEYLFRKFEPEIETIAMINLCRRLKYEFFPAGHIVYKKDQDNEKKIYMLFNGEVAAYDENSEHVYFPTQKHEENSHQPSSNTHLHTSHDHHRHNPSGHTHHTHEKSESNYDGTPKADPSQMHKAVRFSISEFEQEKNDISIDDNHVKIIDGKNVNWKDKIRTIKENECLGEEMFSGESKRPESIVATKDSIFAVLLQSDFEYMQKRYEKNTNMMVRFLGMKFPSVSATEEAFEAKIMGLVSIEEYPHGNYIVYDGLAGEYFYLIYEGMCELQKKVKVSSHHKHLNVKFSETKNVGISIIQPGAIFGEEIIFQESVGYHFSVKVLSTSATVIAFNKKDFVHNFQGDPAFNDFRDFYKNKVHLNSQMMEAKLQSFHSGEPIVLENNAFFQYQPPNKEEKKKPPPKVDSWGFKLRPITKEGDKTESKKNSPERTRRKSPDVDHKDSHVTLEEYLTGRKSEDHQPETETERMNRMTREWENNLMNELVSEVKNRNDSKVLAVQSFRNAVVKIENKPVKLNDINKKIEEITATDIYKKQLTSMLTIKTSKINFGTKEELHRDINNEKLYRTRSGFGQRKKEYLTSQNAWLERTQNIQKEIHDTKINRYPEVKIKIPGPFESDKLNLKRDLIEKKIKFKDFLDIYRTVANYNPNSIQPPRKDSRGRLIFHSRVSSLETLIGAHQSLRSSPERGTNSTLPNFKTRGSVPRITVNTQNTAGSTEPINITENINMSVLSTDHKDGEPPKPIPPLKVIMQY